MKCLREAIFLPFFSSDEWDKIESHTSENFTYLIYNDRIPGKNTEQGVNPPICKIRVTRMNTVTQEVMNTDSGALVSLKCGLMIIVNPVFFLIRAVFHSVKTVKLAVETVGSFIKLTKEDIWNGRSFEVISINFQNFVEKAFNGGTSYVEDIALMIFCYTGVQLAALFGFLFDSLKARKMIQILEQRVNHGEVYHPSKEGTTLFIYVCMQPLLSNFKESDASRYREIWRGKDLEQTKPGESQKLPDQFILPLCPCLC